MVLKDDFNRRQIQDLEKAAMAVFRPHYGHDGKWRLHYTHKLHEARTEWEARQALHDRLTGADLVADPEPALKSQAETLRQLNGGVLNDIDRMFFESEH